MLRQNGRDKDVHISSQCHRGKAKRYFATTNVKTMELLEEYRSFLNTTTIEREK